MRDFFFFLLLFSFLILQRVIELYIAKGNERWMKAQGAIEFGSRHYPIIVLIHSLFFVSLFFEKFLLNRGISPIWPVALTVFFITQSLRIWVITTLGKFWNTKIIVLENKQVVRQGPYRYIKHPNYLVVGVEFVVIPLLFEAYFTAGLFTILNLWIMSVRIPAEEKALKNLTEYETAFLNCRRFLPILLKKSDR